MPSRMNCTAIAHSTRPMSRVKIRMPVWPSFASPPGAAAGHRPAHLGWVPRRHGEERRNRRQGIDDEQDRREDEEQVLERPERVAHIATCTTRSLPARFAAYMA